MNILHHNCDFDGLNTKRKKKTDDGLFALAVRVRSLSASHCALTRTRAQNILSTMSLYIFTQAKQDFTFFFLSVMAHGGFSTQHLLLRAHSSTYNFYVAHLTAAASASVVPPTHQSKNASRYEIKRKNASSNA